MRADHHRLRLRRLAVEGWIGIVEKDYPPGCQHALGRAKRHHGREILGRAVDPGPLGAVKRQLLAVHGEKILAEKLAKMLKKVAKTADQRVISANSMGFLEKSVLHPEYGTNQDGQQHQHRHADHQHIRDGLDPPLNPLTQHDHSSVSLATIQPLPTL